MATLSNMPNFPAKLNQTYVAIYSIGSVCTEMQTFPKNIRGVYAIIGYISKPYVILRTS